MDNQIDQTRKAIRQSWSEGERDSRRRIATNLQLQLRELVFLTTLACQKPVSDRTEPAHLSNAC